MIGFLFSPTGRISCTQFFSAIALVMLTMLLIGFGLGTLPALDASLILSALWIVLTWPLACALIKRLHDTGRSATWLWLLAPQVAMAIASLAVGGFMPGFVLWIMNILGILSNTLCWGLILFLAVRTGDVGDNAYGADPHDQRGAIAANLQ
ncbi:DUF805 domain-containing protein [Asticcacaulis benevestitus]|uniref:DUF805 domain-containing protein n=1 Tax=Asticcacaulis benevestitus DSM 16100 = ATCC BAA-896 TaxID=1121022 RepID=V4PBP8_9CAUL|nr:DUF805 domain-containing protein [Asticcacaulis benevestitus]ESQ85521.1 hypothetical protein ABENE_18620 [Asticcacaulis benevestitus DSM 16100 = ATCC BAA-896]